MVVYQAVYEDSCGDISYGNLFRKKGNCLKEVRRLTSKPTLENYYKFIEDLSDNDPFVSFDEWADEHSSPYRVKIKELTVY